ncbi:MAG: tRNA (adenosine(37)-N6)-threonylcarbamoyltransferase complex dimerization subunit type 1 TsaB [Nocardioidaceae bacterium]
MLVLAFDTATPAITVAIHDGAGVIASATTVDAMSHGELLAPGIARVLADAGAARTDLTDVAVGVGPGPYTGLRVGVVTARTLAASLGLRTHGICTLDAIAADVVRRQVVDAPFAVATDARRKEVYWARYDGSGHRVEGPGVLRPADLAARLPRGTPVLGRGARAYADALAYTEGPLDPDAGVLADVVVRGGAEVLDPEPLYLRRPDAAPPGERKKAS